MELPHDMVNFYLWLFGEKNNSMDWLEMPVV